MLTVELDVDDIYDFTIEITMNDDTTRQATLNIKVSRIDMAIAIDILDTDDDDDGLSTGEVRDTFQMFIDDYLDETVTFDYINEMYFGGLMDTDFQTDRVEDDNNTIVILDLYESDMESFFMVELEFTKLDGTKSVETIEIRVNRIDMAIVIEFDDNRDNDCDTIDEDCDDLGDFDDVIDVDIVLPFFEQFLIDYVDSTVTDQTLADSYFMGMIDADLFTDRQEVQEIWVYSVDSIAYDGNGFFLVMINVTSGDDTETLPVMIKVKRIDASSPLLLIIEDGEDNDCDDDCDGIIIDVATGEIVFDMFIDYYFDSTVTDQMILDMFFAGEESLFIENRMGDMESGLMVEITQVTYNDLGYFDFELMVTDSDGVENSVLRLSIYGNGPGLYLLDFLDTDDDGDLIDFDMASALLEGYKTNYNHMSMLSMGVCQIYVGENQVEGCAYDRDVLVSDGYMLESIYLYVMYDSYRADFTYTNTDGSMIETYDLYFYMNDAGEYVFDYYQPYDPIVADLQMETFEYLSSAIDLTLTDAEVCGIFLDADSLDECVQLRDYLRANPTSMYAGSYVYSEDDMYILSVVITDLEGSYVGAILYYVGHVEMANGENPLFTDSSVDADNPLFAAID